MKLGFQMGYWNKGPYHAIEVAKEAENLGYDSVWTAEAYGSDCVSPLAWLGSHTKKLKLGTSVMQISARTPVCAAMTALTMDHLSEGRFILGVGVSGPQVVEGWYGQPFTRPLERTKEWMEIFRQVIKREAPVEFHGNQYELPLNGGMHLGKPLKSITHPRSPYIPVYMGAEGPKNIQLATEIADGWFPIFVSPYKMDIFDDSIKNRSKDFEIAAMVQVNVNDNLKDALLPVKWMLGLYLGGMGAKGENFHKNLMGRMGYADAAQKVQDLYLAGKQMEAIEAVPDELADEISLCGPVERIKERLEDWKKSPITSLMIGRTDSPEEDIKRLRQFAEMVL